MKGKIIDYAFKNSTVIIITETDEIEIEKGMFDEIIEDEKEIIGKEIEYQQKNGLVKIKFI